MTTFQCATCSAEVETVGSQVWHRCQGRERELQPVAPDVAPPAAVAPQEPPEGHLF